LDIRIVNRWEEVYSESFKDEWMDCYNNAQNSHVFFHPSLCLAWIDTYRKIRDIKPAFCIAKNKDTKIFFPLVLWRQNWKNAGRRLLIPVGYSDFDYHDPLICGNSENFIHEIFFIKLFKFLNRELCFDTIHIDGIRTHLTGKNWMTETEIAPFCELTKYKDSTEILKSLSTSLRGDIRRQQRRIEERGKLHLEKITDFEIAHNILPEFLKNHCIRWPNSYKAPYLHENIIKYGLKSGIVHFSVLRCNDEVLSWHLGFISDKKFYYYMPVIDPAFEKYSPGKIHLFKLTELSLNCGLEVFDHLRGKENYKLGWTNNFSSLYKFRYVRNSPLSVTREMLCKIKNTLV
jgi:CelD/BcsL family acetyltransferase involved in cellulose biosynthesis